MTSTTACIMFIAIAGFIAFLFWRQRKNYDDIQDFYKANHLYNREMPPVEYPFIYTDIRPICSDGFLKPGMPYTFILGSRSVGAGQTRRLDTYIGIFIPDHPDLTEDWLINWKQKVAERSDGWAQHSQVEPIKKSWGLFGAPEHLPILATRINNGVLLSWVGLHIRKTFEARLKDVKKSINE